MSESWRPTLAADRMLLQVRDIHAGYGKLDILHGITLDVGRGELVCIIGPNGSGKSTTLKHHRVLTSQIRPYRLLRKGNPVITLRRNLKGWPRLRAPRTDRFPADDGDGKSGTRGLYREKFNQGQRSSWSGVGSVSHSR